MSQASLLQQLPHVLKQYIWGKRVADFAVLAAVPLFGFLYGVHDVNADVVVAAL